MPEIKNVKQKQINIGLIGFGTVGSGVVKVLKEKSFFLRRACGCDFIIRTIADKDITSPRQIKVDKNILTTDVKKVINDPKIDVIIELIGGINPAREYIIKALQKGKQVITANKALLAECGQEISQTARKNYVNVLFEASVCSGLPIIKSLREGLISNNINAIFGIVNGTSNYILTKMSGEGVSFEEALAEAKLKGFAEKNPSLDVEGIDSSHKLFILATLAFRQQIRLDDIYTEGITVISAKDIKFAGELGYTVKLLAIAKLINKELEVRVHPALLSNDKMLSNVKGRYNAVYIRGDLIGDAVFYGPGAGMMSTAGAVVADLVDLATNLIGKNAGQREVFPAGKRISIRKIQDIKSKYYIRLQALDQPGVLAQISGILGNNKISIASVIQKGRGKQKSAPIVMMTHIAKEANLQQALKKINNLAVIKEKAVVIRIEE
ncbi:MAG: homoserine dehydrogenase [Candidatus Omnitrophota bacterium]|nr:homoserine dehydrogenase [Candidatus Omnitrophota bacterium]